MRLKAYAQAVSAALLVMLFFGGTVAAQSRRRPPVADPPPPVPSAPADPPPSAPPQNKPAAPAVPLIVGVDSFKASFDSLPPSLYDYLYGACVDRLRDSGAVAVTASGEMTRKEAVDRAKSQTETYVLWMEVAADNFNRTNSTNGDNLYVNYTIFSPQTAKTKSSGRVYADTVGVRTGGPVGVSLPTINRRLPIQYKLQLMGAEVADRVLGRMK